jgi:hypothetical protein
MAHRCIGCVPVAMAITHAPDFSKLPSCRPRHRFWETQCGLLLSTQLVKKACHLHCAPPNVDGEAAKFAAIKTCECVAVEQIRVCNTPAAAAKTSGVVEAHCQRLIRRHLPVLALRRANCLRRGSRCQAAARVCSCLWCDAQLPRSAKEKQERHGHSVASITAHVGPLRPRKRGTCIAQGPAGGDSCPE